MKTKHFSVVITDFDGVVVLSEDANIAAGIKTFSDLDQPLSEEEKKMIAGRASSTYVPLFLKARGMNEPQIHQRIIVLNRENYDAIWPDVVRLAPGVAETLPWLHELGVVMAIATTNRRAVVHRFYERFGVGQYFRFEAVREDVLRSKPCPDIYSLAARKVEEELGITKNFILTAEDTAIGIQAAKAAGLYCAAIPNEHSRDDDFSQADVILASFAEIVDLIA